MATSDSHPEFGVYVPDVTVVDDIAPVISINALTTLDTSPIVSGSARDATSLTLVVTGVGTYTPTPPPVAHGVSNCRL